MNEATKGTYEAKQDRPVWYLAGPFYQYNEDVKKLASKHGLRIIDANVTTDREFAVDAKDTPKVTIKAEFQPAEVDVKAPSGKAPSGKS